MERSELGLDRWVERNGSMGLDRGVELNRAVDLDRRRFLLRMVQAGVALVVLPSLPRWVRAARFSETARAWRAMGTLIEVRIPDLPAGDAIAAIGRVRARVEELEAAMTVFRPESPLVALNAAPEGEWMDGPPDLALAMRAAVDAVGTTSGAYDPSVAPAMKAWGLYDLSGEEATPAFLRSWRSRPGSDAVEIDLANSRLRRLDPRVELDLGGIGKGIAVDAALTILRQAGSRSALVNLGGEIGVLGAPEDAPEGWPVGIAHPRRPGDTCTEFPLRSGHVATSGDYERWVDAPSGRKHHILDPNTALSAPGVASVTVWRASGCVADIASTASFVLASRGERISGPALVIREKKGELLTEGSPEMLKG
jgi:FAD:protein FMN transferase